MKFDKSYSLKELAEWLAISYEGDPNFEIFGLNEIHMVEAGDMTFVDHPKYYDKALNSAATTILINKKVPCPEGKALLISEDPFADFNRLITRFRSLKPASNMISPLAEIGEGTVVQPGAFVGDHVKIGKNSLIHSNATLYDHTIIGDNVIIHAGVVLGADAFYFQRKPAGYRKFISCGRVIIDDDVEIGANCTIDKGVTGDTHICKGVKFDNGVQVGHDTYVGKNTLIGAQCAIAGVTVIEEDVLLWARIVVNKDLVVGKGVIVLATSGIDKSISGEGVTFFGSPVMPVMQKWREMAAVRQLPALLKKIK